jgi:hypothetical protein
LHSSAAKPQSVGVGGCGKARFRRVGKVGNTGGKCSVSEFFEYLIKSGLLDNPAVLGDAVGVSYPGGKNGLGVYQAIINRMPPHQVYIEPFLGLGAREE